MNKYYYIHAKCGGLSYACVLDIHPFEWLDNELKRATRITTLISWQEITQEEFNLYRRIIEQIGT